MNTGEGLGVGTFYDTTSFTLCHGDIILKRKEVMSLGPEQQYCGYLHMASPALVQSPASHRAGWSNFWALTTTHFGTSPHKKRKEKEEMSPLFFTSTFPPLQKITNLRIKRPLHADDLGSNPRHHTWFPELWTRIVLSTAGYGPNPNPHK